MITITIDGQPCKAQEGEYVLNIARRNDIFIPALCYLSGCSPTLACRLCIIDVDGKRAYACNAKAKDGMSVISKNEELDSERRAIMQVYDVNHPLECGVCDQSGECELQNYNLELEVDSQNFSIADLHRPIAKWGKIQYDPSLCIVCERCITVCKDKIGETALKTVPRGGDALEKELKDSMPKDAYAMWNKLQKSLIGPNGEDTLICTQCGECAAVCPVGALVGSDFQYKANAWELKRVPALNPHSSDCTPLYYELRHGSISSPKDKLFRVSNEFHFATLNPAARWGYDFQNCVEKKDEESFNKIVNAIKTKEIKTIKFNSFITNEEVLILNKIKEKYGLKLVNEEARRYQEFLNSYAKASGSTLYSANAKDISESKFTISVGTALKTDAPNLGYALNNALKINKSSALYFHPLKDPIIKGYHKNILTIPHAIGKEEAVLWWVLSKFAKELPQNIQDEISKYKYTTTKEVEESVRESVKEVVVDESGESKEVTKVVVNKVIKKVEIEGNKLWEMMGVEDFEDEVNSLLKDELTISLIAGEDLYTHPRASSLAKLLGLIARYAGVKVMLIPPQTNTLGVALISTLDKECDGKVLGYNEKGDFTISALGNGDLDMPSLNQQEGTFVSFDKKVMPTYAALKYGGYSLNDIANALEIKAKYTVSYTSTLPEKKGFKKIEFDQLDYYFENDGTSKHGYELSVETVEASDEVDSLKVLKWDEGESIYFANPVHQFSPFTNRAHQLNEAGALYVSSSWLEKRALADGSMVKIVKDGVEPLIIKIKLDPFIDGEIAYLPSFDTKIGAKRFFNPYRFATVSIEGVKDE